MAVYFASELVSVENLEAALAQAADNDCSGASPHSENHIQGSAPAATEISETNSDVPSVDSASAPAEEPASPGCHAVAFTGDISEAHCDVLIASLARTSNHKQFAITDALKSIAGTHFHDRADQVGPVENLSAILVRKSADTDLPFGDVLLVAHDGSTSVQAFIFTALQHADKLGYSTAAIPLLNFVTETKPDAETVSTLLLQVQEAYLALQRRWRQIAQPGRRNLPADEPQPTAYAVTTRMKKIARSDVKEGSST